LLSRESCPRWVYLVYNIERIYYGAYKSRGVKENLVAIRTIWKELGFIKPSDEICQNVGKLKASLEKKGDVMDDADMFIAACALVNDATLVTNEMKSTSDELKD